MSETRPGLRLLRWGAVPFILLTVYVGAYYGTVKPIPVFDANVTMAFTGEFLPRYPRLEPDGSAVKSLADLELWQRAVARRRAIFAPIHAIDRLIRPSVWSQEPDQTAPLP
jgi:hypothetical protein